MVKEYKLNKCRIASLWMIPILLLLIIGFFIFITDKTFSIVFLIVVAVLFTGPFFHLYFNHLKLAANTKIIFEGENVVIIQNEDTYSFSMNEIVQVIEYSSQNKMSEPMWGNILKWEIITNGKSLEISNLTISKSDFEKHFKSTITHRYQYFPFIRN